MGMEEHRHRIQRSLLIVEPVVGIELDSHDVNIFWTVPEAESYVEPADIDNWLVFDANGKKLQITLTPEHQKVTLVATGEADKGRLQSFLEGYLSQPKLSRDRNVAALEKFSKRLRDSIE